MKLAFDNYRSKAAFDHPNRKRFTVIALHGLLGTKKNWSVVAHKLVNYADKRNVRNYNDFQCGSTITGGPRDTPILFPSSFSDDERRIEFDFFALDLRNHGDSPHHNEHSLDSMSADLAETIPHILDPRKREQHFPHTADPYTQPIVLMGHSMGGAAVLHHSWNEMCSHYEESEGGGGGSSSSSIVQSPSANAEPQQRQRMVSTQCAENNLIIGNVVVDMAPAPRPASFYRMFDIFRLMQKIPLNGSGPDAVQSRGAAQQWLTQQVAIRLGGPPLDPGFCSYLLTNMASRPRGGEGPAAAELFWKPNLKTLIDCGPKVLWKVPEPIERQKVEVPTLFLFGGNSSYKNEQSLAAIPRYFHAPVIEIIAGAGHFVHVEKRDATVDRVYQFISTL